MEYLLCKQTMKGGKETMCQPLGENDAAGLNVTVWEGGQVSKRGKMSHRENMS
jgi:hypothetical protein